MKTLQRLSASLATLRRTPGGSQEASNSHLAQPTGASDEQVSEAITDGLIAQADTAVHTESEWAGASTDSTISPDIAPDSNFSELLNMLSTAYPDWTLSVETVQFDSCAVPGIQITLSGDSEKVLIKPVEESDGLEPQYMAIHDKELTAPFWVAGGLSGNDLTDLDTAIESVIEYLDESHA